MPINKKPRNESIEDKKPMSFYISEPLYRFEDLILDKGVIDEIRQTIALEKYGDLIYEKWGLKNVIKQKRNISINLFGASGTGKTMTAHAIANELHKKILLVNYAEIESKYVGETSKNLIRLFEYAKEKGVLIAFDEADALLSKRVTAMSSATDVSVNQTRNVLLRILDDYSGVVVFTTNFIKNYDKAFLRRITSHIKIDVPNRELRKELWKHYLVSSLPIVGDRDEIADRLAGTDNITGADISTVVLKAAVNIAVNEEKGLDIDLLDMELQKIVEAKKAMDNRNEFQVTTRKVSEEYVKEQEVI